MIPFLLRFAETDPGAPRVRLRYSASQRLNELVDPDPEHAYFADGTTVTKTSEARDQHEVGLELAASLLRNGGRGTGTGEPRNVKCYEGTTVTGTAEAKDHSEVALGIDASFFTKAYLGTNKTGTGEQRDVTWNEGTLVSETKEAKDQSEAVGLLAAGEIF